ncbi:MAG: D-arabinose 5-phosphate isomerase [Bacteroidetes bacterium RIFCSPLOWO2_12_FULL_31_6]|nr:MAG: D-arabinose 5-phosphate isomerase [Bacteroidetes bacterium RIFCSPLOWO2_12_FULL_31_6]
MKTTEEIKKIAISTIQIEAQSIKDLINYIDDSFVHCIEYLAKNKGRIIATGVGKSAQIARKIVGTLSSTGSSSIFMHAADAIHGDLGIIQADDVVLCLSKSGDTSEIKVLVPLIKNMGNKIVAITGNINSYLAKNADYVLNSTVEKEACPNNLAPTSSTTAQLVIGDALAMCLLACKDFTPNDFAKLHPGGSLGKRLYLRVDDIFQSNEVPKVNADDSVRKAILEISSKRLGATAVMQNDILIGIITDGDIRRMLEKPQVNIETLKAKDIMSPNPRTLEAGTLAVDALSMMQKNKITQVLIANQGKYVGIVHIHDLMKEGIV